MTRPRTSPRDADQPLRRRHDRLGWWTIFVSASTGVVLEALHGFKVPWYVAAGNETRRLLLTLSHAHGVLLGLLNLALALTFAQGDAIWPRGRAASVCMALATVLIPVGFFLGGLFVHAGDPGLGSLLVPPGAVALLIALGLTATRR